MSNQPFSIRTAQALGIGSTALLSGGPHPLRPQFDSHRTNRFHVLYIDDGNTGSTDLTTKHHSRSMGQHVQARTENLPTSYLLLRGCLFLPLLPQLPIASSFNERSEHGRLQIVCTSRINDSRYLAIQLSGAGENEPEITCAE